MAFQIKFYKSGNEAKLVQKTLPTPITLQGTAKEACDIVDPVILVEYTTSGNFEYNYCYIAQWARYYFVTKKVVEQTGLWTISLHCDVLMTYGSSIDSLNAYVGRSENLYNNSYVDTRYPLLASSSVFTENFPEDPFNSEFSSALTYRKNIVLTLSSKSFSGTLPTPADWPDVSPLHRPYRHTESFSAPGNYSYAINTVLFESVIDGLYDIGTFDALKQGDKSEGIISVIVYPFDLEDHDPTRLASLADIKIFKNTSLGTNGQYISPYYNPIFDFGTISMDSGASFLRYYPYSKYEVYLPYIGFVDVDPSEILGTQNKVLGLKYAVDLNTGACTAYLYTKDSIRAARIIKTANGHIGQRIALTSTNAVEQARNVINGLTGFVSGALGAVTSASVGNISGVLSSGASALSAGLGMLFNPSTSRGEQVNQNLGLYAPSKATFIRTTRDVDSAHLGQYLTFEGQPAMRTTYLSNCVGYTEIKRIHLTGLTGATSGEIDELESLLKSGVIFGSTPHYPL